MPQNSRVRERAERWGRWRKGEAGEDGENDLPNKEDKRAGKQADIVGEEGMRGRQRERQRIDRAASVLGDGRQISFHICLGEECRARWRGSRLEITFWVEKAHAFGSRGCLDSAAPSTFTDLHPCPCPRLSAAEWGSSYWLRTGWQVAAATANAAPHPFDIVTASQWAAESAPDE